MFSQPRSDLPSGAKPAQAAVSVGAAASIPSLKRCVNNIDHPEASDSFRGGCLTGAGRVAAARRAAVLRRK